MNAEPAIARAPAPPLGQILLLGGLTGFAAFTIDTYLPALPTIAREFGVPDGRAVATMSAFFAGMAVGQLIYGPLSDRVGRRPPLLAGTLVYAAASVLCALAPSLEWLIAGRVGQALGACAGVVIARAVVSDRYAPTEAARLFSLLFLVLGVAPMLAPSVGAALMAAFGWRAIFLVLAAFGLTLFVAVWRGLPESRSAATAATAAGESVAASYWEVLRNRRLLGFVLTGACNGAALFTYVAGSSTLFIGHFGVTPAQFGWIFALNAAGLIAASQANRWLLTRTRPERLMALGSVGASICGAVLVLLGITGWGGLWGVMLMIFLALGSYGFVSSNAMALALGVDRTRAGAISAVMGSASFAVGAAASAAAAALYDGSPVPMVALIALGFFGSTAALFGLAGVRLR